MFPLLLDERVLRITAAGLLVVVVENPETEAARKRKSRDRDTSIQNLAEKIFNFDQVSIGPLISDTSFNKVCTRFSPISTNRQTQNRNGKVA